MGTPLRVLIVEDSEDDAILIVRELKHGGYNPVFERVDTPEAMNAALDQKNWDIILSDYVMPCFSMPGALQMMREKGLDLPFIVISGAIGEESAVEVMRAGAHDYVMKDKLARLVPAIERELREAETRRKQKQMEEALRESEEKLRHFVEEMNDGYCVIQKSRVVFANTRSAEMFGYVQEEVTGKTIGELLPPQIVEKLIEMHAKRKRGENVPPQYEIALTRRDNTTCWVEFGARMIEYGGKPAASVVIRDITERKLMEEEKKRMEQQLHFAGRLAAVGELAAGVAHELNNPLAAVLLYSQLLQGRDDLDETIRSDVETVHKEAQRAARITNSLLSFARRHKPEKIPLSINGVIENSLELNAGRLRIDHIDMVMDLEQDLPKTMADFHQMQQVFVNIINNADQAMFEAHGRGTLCVKSQKAGDMIQITFTDDGPGISEENIKRVFDPFFTTKDVGKGTGLGLSICYGIVEEHGGSMSVKSTAGQGATFIVEIPIETNNHQAFTDDNDPDQRNVKSKYPSSTPCIDHSQ